jgi:hypothetical protein
VRVVVSGSHASGKSTLVADLTSALPCDQLPDPFELVDQDDDPSGAASFVAQLRVAAERLLALPTGSRVVAERGPLDLLAYLEALDDLGRPSVDAALMGSLRATTQLAMGQVDLLVVLPLDARDGIHVPDDEDPDLREAMDARLLDLVDDPDPLPVTTTVVEVAGSPDARLDQVLAAVRARRHRRSTR